MVIKSILAPFYTPMDTSALETALDLAKRFGAHLEALHVTPNFREGFLAYFGAPYLPSVYPEQMIDHLVVESHRTREKAQDLFTQIVSNKKVDITTADEETKCPSASFLALDGRPEKLFAIRSRISDLIVIGRRSDESHESSGLIRTALFKTGRPILLMPPKLTKIPLLDKVIISWNGSFEASRALHLALPFLINAKVRVFTGIEGGIQPPISASELVVYLRRYGIEADAVTPELLNETREEALERAVVEFGAGMVVMGAYNREERIRETILGSYTGEILDKGSFPVMVAS